MRQPLTPKIAGAIAGAIALIVALGAAGAVAASRALSPGDESKAVIDDAASRLGVEPSALTKALKDALKARVDAAVDAGRLTEAQGKELKARIDSNETPLLFGGLAGPRLGDFGHFGHLGAFAHLDTAASYLGLDESALREQLRDGKTLADVAKAQGKSVDGLVQALVADAKSRLDEAVADGRLTRAQADEIAAGLEDRMRELVDGELPERGFGHRLGDPDQFGERFGPGFRRHGPRA